MSDDVNHRDGLGRTALYRAAEAGDLEQCRDLVARGADLEFRNKWGVTAVMWVAREGHLETGEVSD